MSSFSPPSPLTDGQLIRSTFHFSNTFCYPCGLVVNTNLLTRRNSCLIVGGFYKGNSVLRLRNHDMVSPIIVFEASRFQSNTNLVKQFSLLNVQFEFAALGCETPSGYANFGDFQSKVTVNQGTYGYGSLISTDDRPKNSTYKVPVVNLCKYLEAHPYYSASHIHLDIEGAELDVISQFGSSLSNYSLQLSLELQARPGSTLLDAYRELSTLSKLNNFIPLIVDSCTHVPFPDVPNYLRTHDSASIYYIHISTAFTLCNSLYSEAFLAAASKRALIA